MNIIWEKAQLLEWEELYILSGINKIRKKNQAKFVACELAARVLRSPSVLTVVEISRFGSNLEKNTVENLTKASFCLHLDTAYQSSMSSVILVRKFEKPIIFHCHRLNSDNE